MVTKAKVNKGNGKVSEEEFVLKSIKTLRTEGRLGIHVVYSGFNKAFEKYFGTSARATVDRMVQSGKIAARPCKGGVMLYLADEQPVVKDKADEALAKLGLS